MARDELSLLLKNRYRAGPLANVVNRDEMARQLQVRYNITLHESEAQNIRK